MAMTPDEASRPMIGADLPGEDVLAAAAADLRDRVDPRWVAISDRVLASALTATRRSRPLRAQAASGPVSVSEQVLIAHVRHALDGRVPGTAVAAIHVNIEGRDSFSGLIIEIVAEYGRPLLPLADRVHALAAAELVSVLGPLDPLVSVRATHVHVNDVTRGDPQEADSKAP